MVICLDFANTVDRRPTQAPLDRLRDYADLATWAAGAGLVSPRDARALAERARRQPGATADVMRQAARLREAIYRVISAGVPPTGPRRRPRRDQYRGRRRARRIAAHASWRRIRPAMGRGIAGLWIECSGRSPSRLKIPDLDRSDRCPGMRSARLRPPLRGHEPQPHPPLVRHARLWQPIESPPLLCPAQSAGAARLDLGAKAGEELAVGGRKRVVREAGGLDPGVSLALLWLDWPPARRQRKKWRTIVFSGYRQVTVSTFSPTMKSAPSSSLNSRRRHSSRVSPTSRLPPGNSQRPSRWEPAARRVMR